jgi:hypothetical protein
MVKNKARLSDLLSDSEVALKNLLDFIKEQNINYCNTSSDLNTINKLIYKIQKQFYQD